MDNNYCTRLIKGAHRFAEQHFTCIKISIQDFLSETNLRIFVVGIYMTEHGKDKGSCFSCS